MVSPIPKSVREIDWGGGRKDQPRATAIFRAVNIGLGRMKRSFHLGMRERKSADGEAIWKNTPNIEDLVRM